MAFGMEAVIPLESKFPTLRFEHLDPEVNDEAIAKDLDLAEEKRDDARHKLANYQQKLLGAMIIMLGSKSSSPSTGSGVTSFVSTEKTKFKPNWEGPYRVVKIVGERSYKVEDKDGNAIANPWNAQNLSKAYL